MKIQIIRKKASSLRELGREEREVGPVSTLRELLTAVARSEFEKQHGEQFPRPEFEKRHGEQPSRSEFEKQHGNRDFRPGVKSEEELRGEGKLGKIQFGELYNDTPGDWEKALNTLFQDFEDGLYRVYVDGIECTMLDQPVTLCEGSQVVFIRLVMLSGRLW